MGGDRSPSLSALGDPTVILGPKKPLYLQATAPGGFGASFGQHWFRGLEELGRGMKVAP